MKKRIFQLVFLILTFGVFASCDPEAKATYYFENKSSHIVYVDPGARIFTISPNEVTIIGRYQHIGDATPAWVAYNSLKIYTDSGVCKKNPGVDFNWISTNPKRYTYEYRFVVQDSDF